MRPAPTKPPHVHIVVLLRGLQGTKTSCLVKSYFLLTDWTYPLTELVQTIRSVCRLSRNEIVLEALWSYIYPSLGLRKVQYTTLGGGQAESTCDAFGAFLLSSALKK